MHTILLNFAHPLTAAQLAQITELAGQPPARVLAFPAHFDVDRPFGPQLAALLDVIPLTAEQWQTTAILVNPPAQSTIAVLLLADLHGRLGYFPATLRLRRVPNALPPRFEVAELLDLQSIREAARKTRQG